MEGLGEECGIAAVLLPKGMKDRPFGGAAYYLYKMLLQQQHRGQQSAGITTFNKERTQLIDTHKGIGMVNEVFRSHHEEKNKAILNEYSGSAGIGHVRYATSGKEDEGSAQPFERHHGRLWKWFSFAFNGHVANFSDLKKELIDSSYHLVRNIDTELMMHFISKASVGNQKRPLEDVFGDLAESFDGTYNTVYLNAEGTIAVVRDPVGVRPLSYAEQDGLFLAASESCALTSCEAEKVKNVAPGEMVLVQDGNMEVKRFTKKRNVSHCMFEWVYFSNPASVVDKVSVYEARWRLGEQLAKKEALETNGNDFVVVAVPDTAKPAASGYAHEKGLPLMEGLIRNRYVGRTFIEGNNRASIAREKYNVNRAAIEGKKIILVDDSIVRGTTGKSFIAMVKKVGKPKEIHMRVSCPPIKYPCFYGTDMSTLQELVAPKHMDAEEVKTTGIDVSEKAIESIGKEMSLNSLAYQDIAGLKKAISLPEESGKLCAACLTGNYPTECGKKLFCKALEEFSKNPGKKHKRVI
jgi:amidophosphoribosyltransferase